MFLDSSAFYAALDARERKHPDARSLFEHLRALGAQLYTSNYVAAEAHALILRRVGRVVALRFLSDLDRSATTVIGALPADEQRARAILRRYDDKDFSLTDAISFAIMERLGISQAFSFDSDFAQYGFDVLSP